MMDHRIIRLYINSVVERIERNFRRTDWDPFIEYLNNNMAHLQVGWNWRKWWKISTD